MLCRTCLCWISLFGVLLACHLVTAAEAAGLPSTAAAVAHPSQTPSASAGSLQQHQHQHQQQQQQAAHRQLLQVDKPVVVAHRGASGPLPEHTVPAYLEAIKEGADFIECDVVVTRDLQLICRHEPNLNDTTDAMELFGDRASTYLIDGVPMTGVFASDLTLAEVRQLRARQRWQFRDHSHDGKYGLVTFEEYIDIALAAGRPVGIYPEAKHPSWHNQLPALQAAHTTLEELMVKVLHAKGYAASAPHSSIAWRAQPVFIQCFEVTSLRRFAALTPVPLALLLDNAPCPDTGLSPEVVLSDKYLSTLAPFVTVIAPWKAMLYSLAGGRRPAGAAAHTEVAAAEAGVKAGAAAGAEAVAATAAASGSGLVLPAGASSVNGTDSNRRLLAAPAAAAGSDAAAGGFRHPDVPLSDESVGRMHGTQELHTTGLAARLHKLGFLVHTFTLRDEGQFVLPTCQQGIACEFEWLFGEERVDGGFADWPGTMHQWLQQHHRR